MATMTIKLSVPWWVRRYVTLMKFAYRVGFPVNTEKVGNFVTRHVKMDKNP